MDAETVLVEGKGEEGKGEEELKWGGNLIEASPKRLDLGSGRFMDGMMLDAP